MKTRILASKVKEFANSYPVVTIVGPRQSGKTTLAKLTFPDYQYVNLEALNEREFAQTDPIAFLERFREKRVILDEVQRVPELLSQIQVMVDANKQNGHFILTGSHNFSLMRTISQSLAGRTALCTLFPFSSLEISDILATTLLNEMMWKGFYPKIHTSAVSAADEFAFYVSTYIERDVREIEHIKNLRAFSRFLRLTAGRTGCVLNIASLATDAGISPKQASDWLSILEASYIIRFLEPWHANVNKRLVKAPKLYFVDVGLACYLMGIFESTQLEVHPLRGEIFETMVVGEAFKQTLNVAAHQQLYYYRDSNKNEIDLVLQEGLNTRLIEIKSGATFSKDWVKTAMRLREQFGEKTSIEVVYGGDETQQRTDFKLTSWRDFIL
ncbi:MAG: ATP-binding protein [Kiritimatiellae bacterium]|nr:ATP-binding protein [Kiritimatiellia bacterium]